MSNLFSFFKVFIALVLDKRKKVLLTFYDLGLGGIQTKIIDLANELAKNKDNCVIVYLHKRSDFERDYLLDDSVIVLYNPTFFSNLVKNRYYYLLLAIFLCIKPNKVFISLEKASLFSIYWIERFKLDIKLIANIDTNYRFEQKVDRTTAKSLFNKASIVTAVSKATYKDMKERVGVNSPPLKYLPNWTSEKKMATQKRSNSIVFLGRFEPQKRPMLVLHFALLAKRQKIPVHISMYGAGSLQPQMEAFILKYKLQSKVTIFEPSHSAISILMESEFMIVTSLYEGLSFAMLEAMSVGTPILALEAPGVSELVNDGISGILRSDLVSLFKGYKEIYRREFDKYKELQKNTQKIQREKYGRKTMLKLVQLLDPQKI